MWTYPLRWWYIRQEQYSTHPFCISFLLFVFVLFAPSEMGLIFRGKFKTSVSSSPSALLWQLLLLLLLKPLLTLAYSERESNSCLQRQLEKLDVFIWAIIYISIWWMNSTTLSSLTRMQMIPPSAYYISPLHEKVLQRGYTPTKDYSCFFFGILSVFFYAWVSIMVQHSCHACDSYTIKSGKLRGWNFEQILRYIWGNLRWNHGCPDSIVKMHCFGSFFVRILVSNHRVGSIFRCEYDTVAAISYWLTIF
jgi:hypothetical protein